MTAVREHSPLLLCILDGLGYRTETEGNAVELADTPTLDRLFAEHPHAFLRTHGEFVGLPKGQMGNSEVGHLNIGAGRVVEQDLVRISRECDEGRVFREERFLKFLAGAQETSQLHLIGLCSTGGVHSHLGHLHALIAHAAPQWKGKIVLHIITDGRDVPPTSSLQDLATLLHSLPETVRIGTVSGRYYMMDRDKRWERIAEAHQSLLAISTHSFEDPLEYIQDCHSQGISDEFLPPAHANSFQGYNSTDLFICWNYRADRMREIYQALTGGPEALASGLFAAEHAISERQMLTFAQYDETFRASVLFPTHVLNNVFGEVVARAGLSQLRIAETEKYPHVTYFLSGGKEAALPGETRTIIPSPRDVKTYDEKPQMSAAQVGTAVREAIASREFDVIVLNFANPDMVGHTGNLGAAIQAVECIDSELGKILASLRQVGGEALIFADHGNAEEMLTKDGGPHTFHTTNIVPIWYYGDRSMAFSTATGALCDIAPTALKLLGLDIPTDMTGTVLLSMTAPAT